jgi:hypothetical protein
MWQTSPSLRAEHRGRCGATPRIQSRAPGALNAAGNPLPDATLGDVGLGVGVRGRARVARSFLDAEDSSTAERRCRVIATP